jgi:hypothetical protein
MKYPDRIKKSIWAFGHEQTSTALMIHMLNEVYKAIEEVMIGKPPKGTH